MNICFFLDSRPNRVGEYAVRVSVSMNGAKYFGNLGVSVDRTAWKGGLSALYVNARGVKGEEIIARIQCVREGLGRWESRLHEQQPGRREFRAKLKHLLSGQEESACVRAGILWRVNEFIEEQRVMCQWSEGTVANMEVLRRHLSRFCPHEECDFFDVDGLESWLRYLRSSARMEESSVRKMYMCLRWFLNWAIRKGYMQETAVRTYRPKYKLVPKPVIFLTKRELLSLGAYQIPANGTGVELRDASGRRYVKMVRNAAGLEKARDLFLFCAFTSLRYSDMAKLCWSDVSRTIIYVTAKKTRARLPIDISRQARKILEKYACCSFPGGRVLPSLSCQKMNKYLKELCELCGINAPVVKVEYRNGERCEKVYPKYALMGTHAARRSFICFALSQGISPQVVMKWTGHSDYRSMRPYIDIASGVKASAMRRLSAAWEK